MASIIPSLPYDPELVVALENLNASRPFTVPNVVTKELIMMVHANPGMIPMPTAEKAIGDFAVSHIERNVPGVLPKDPDVTISVFTPTADVAGLRPCIYYIHGGGMILMNRFNGVATPLSWVEETGAVVVSVEYRLAPENTHPTLVNDCYAGLIWVREHFKELNVDPERLMIMGQSAGGGLAAGVALMARDSHGPKLCAQYLGCPMLDDRNDTISSRQYEEAPWSRGTNAMAWNAVLDGKAGAEVVSCYAAPARATDLSGLPPAFIDVGSAEVFRDEAVAYASRLWASGVQADLHVYGGGYHGFDSSAPATRLGAIARSVQRNWVRNALKK